MCRSREYEILVEGPDIAIVRCRLCHLMRLSPELPAPVVRVFEHADHAGGKERYLRQWYRKEESQVRDYMPIQSVLTGFIPNKGSVLEVGCGPGDFLPFLKEKGWEVIGLDQNEDYTSNAREKYGVEIIPAIFEEADLHDEMFDVIIMLHFLEHLDDPRSAIEKAFRLLKPGGMLVIETPRIDTIWFRILGHRERNIIQEHLYYFTRKSITNLLTHCGLELMRIDMVGRTLTIDRLFFNIAKLINVKSLSRFLVKVSDLLQLDRFTLKINLRDLIRVYVKKPEVP